MRISTFLVLCCWFGGFNWLYSNVFAIVFRYKYYCAIGKGIQCVIPAHANVYTWVVNSTTLTLDDVTSFYALTTENFNTESLALRLTAVL